MWLWWSQWWRYTQGNHWPLAVYIHHPNIISPPAILQLQPALVRRPRPLPSPPPPQLGSNPSTNQLMSSISIRDLHAPRRYIYWWVADDCVSRPGAHTPCPACRAAQSTDMKFMSMNVIRTTKWGLARVGRWGVGGQTLIWCEIRRW